MGTVDTQGSLADEESRPHEHTHSEHGHRHGHGHHHGHEHHHHEEPMSAEEAVRSLLVLGQVALDAGDYGSAIEAYASALQLGQDETASYNLGSLYARGLGVNQDFVKAAALFHQAELLGNERAGKLCAKCMFDYLDGGISDKTPLDLYVEMAVFVGQVYPEATDAKQEVGSGLFALASTYLNRGDSVDAAKAFRAAAEYANDSYAQYYLGLLYDAGAGVPENDLAALYWVDCAADHDVAGMARGARDDMLGAYREKRSASEFAEDIATLAGWCETGTEEVPANPAKAARWRELA